MTASAQDGKVTAKYWTHGAGRPYRLKGDPAATRSPLTPAFPAPAPAAGGGRGRGGRGGAAALPAGQLPLETANGVSSLDGAQGMEFRDGLLYYSVLPSRSVYVVDPKTWEAQAIWPCTLGRQSSSRHTCCRPQGPFFQKCYQRHRKRLSNIQEQLCIRELQDGNGLC